MRNTFRVLILLISLFVNSDAFSFNIKEAFNDAVSNSREKQKLSKILSESDGYDKEVEKVLKKQYREVTYIPQAKCYMVMSKVDKEHYGICKSNGEILIPAVYKKISIETTDDGFPIFFAMNPNPKAASQGTLIYSLSGKLMDMGRSEPIYVSGGYITATGRPIYNLSGNIVLDCYQSSVQPVRNGREIVGYRVGTRRQVNNSAKDELVICDPSFNQLFVLDGTSYTWKIDIDVSGPEVQWRCTKSLGGSEKMVLLYASDGTLLENSHDPAKAPAQPALAAVAPAVTPTTRPVSSPAPQASSAPQVTLAPQPAVASAPRKKSDVDINPPMATKVNDKTFAVIISNENYSEVENVKFALNDGEMVATYFEKTLGIPKTNIKYVPDATLNNMRKQINWLKDIADAFGQEAKVIFYYSGHGVPDEASKNAYLMPVDGYHSDMSTNLSINKLYEDLSSLNVAQVTVFMDACFSGSQRGDNMLVAARGVKIKSRADAPKGKMVVFSAAQGDETAYPLEEQQHGLFTYYLLKKLRESGSMVTLGELSEYITSEVKKSSLVQNGKIQTPSTSVSAEIEDSWRERSL